LIKINYRLPFDLSSLKTAKFETYADAIEFKRVMESENYIVFHPYTEVVNQNKICKVEVNC
jgi:hypothetical protein